MKTLVVCISMLFLCLLLSSVTLASDVTLSWDANSETDLAGYKIYYKTDFVEYTDVTPLEDELNQGASPIVLNILDPTTQNYIDNINPEIMLTGFDLTTKDYWFVVTAYNTFGEESGFSNEVTTLDLLPISPSEPVASSGGGSSGCFISTTIINGR